MCWYKTLLRLRLQNEREQAAELAGRDAPSRLELAVHLVHDDEFAREVDHDVLAAMAARRNDPAGKHLAEVTAPLADPPQIAVAHGLYYDDQKAEALTCTRHFLAERVPKFLGYFERVLGPRDYMVGTGVTYVDLSIYQLFEGLRFSFPEAMQRLEPQYPQLAALRDRIAARPRIAAYRGSPRCMGFNDRGVFRYYAELDDSPG